jgi:hypothetical protein
LLLSQTLPEIQEVTPLPSARSLKKKTGRKPGLAEEETGWNDESTGLLLLSFLEDNFAAYKKNKSNFAKAAANKVFPGK